MSATMKRLKVTVTGRVLGVSFRSQTQRKATRLGLKGYVCAAPGRAVEVVAEGPQEALTELLGWLREGPGKAEVEDAEVSWEPARGVAGRFTIKYTGE